MIYRGCLQAQCQIKIKGQGQTARRTEDEEKDIWMKKWGLTHSRREFTLKSVENI